MPSSSTNYTSSTSAAATSSSTSVSTLAHDPRNAVVGVVLGVLGCLLLIGVALIMVRVRKRSGNGGEESGPFQGIAVWDRRHPAARVVPFGTPGNEGYRFYRDPGKEMRIAIRRPDGAWDFTHPSEPFTPSGISDLQPSPVSSRTNIMPSNKSHNSMSTNSRSAIMEYKEQESRAAQMIRLGYDARDDMGDGPLPHPPPAYGHEPTVGPYVTFRPSTTSTSSRNVSG